MAKVAHKFTIEITPRAEALPVDSFLEAIDEMIGIVRDVDAKMSGRGQPRIRWAIERMSMNSPATIDVIGFTEAGVSDDVVAVALKGIGSLTKQAKSLPSRFAERTADRARSIGNLLNDGVAAVRITRGKNLTAEPTQQTAANVETILSRDHVFAEGSLDGKLETFDIHGREQFAIYDRFDGSKIVCRFEQALYNKVYKAIGHRVSVTGRIRFDRKGRPDRMEAEDLEVIRTGKLPRFAQGKGLPSLQGVDVVQLVRKSRDAED